MYLEVEMLSIVNINEIITGEQGDYRWDDVAALKTQAKAYVSLVEKIKAMVPEDVPCTRNSKLEVFIEGRKTGRNQKLEEIKSFIGEI